jgi:hypothetical protein
MGFFALKHGIAERHAVLLGKNPLNHADSPIEPAGARKKAPLVSQGGRCKAMTRGAGYSQPFSAAFSTAWARSFTPSLP